MPFGCVPIRQAELKAELAALEPGVSNAFRLCAYSAGRIVRPTLYPARRVSNAFRLCAYSAAVYGALNGDSGRIVSNAFRLCAYSADKTLTEYMTGARRSPMPFGCVPIRQQPMRSP